MKKFMLIKALMSNRVKFEKTNGIFYLPVLKQISAILKRGFRVMRAFVWVRLELRHEKNILTTR